jgi:hypothetical protein
VIDPPDDPAVARLNRTKIVVVATVPPDGAIVTEDPNPLPLVFDTWKSEGAVTTRSAVRLAPATVYDCSFEGVPAIALNGLSDPASVIEGGGAEAVPLTASDCEALPLTWVIEPLEAPAVARLNRT